MTEEVKEEYQYWEKDEKEKVDVDPVVSVKLSYIENLQQEIEGIQGQMASLQYQRDKGVTALTRYQSTLQPEEEEPKPNGKDDG